MDVSSELVVTVIVLVTCGNTNCPVSSCLQQQSQRQAFPYVLGSREEVERREAGIARDGDAVDGGDVAQAQDFLQVRVVGD